MSAFCKLEGCKAVAAEMLYLGEQVGVFCGVHFGAFVASHEAARARAAAEGHDGYEAPFRQVLVAALSDFRTRVELEARRDKDEQVIAARGGR